MEPELLLVPQQRQLEEQQNKEEFLQQRGTEPAAAIKKDHEEQGIGEFNLVVVSSDELGGGRNPPREGEGELSQGGVALQSYDTDIERTNVGSDDLTESRRQPHLSPERIIQQNLRPAATLEERGSGATWSGRLRSRAPTATTRNSDHINSGQLQFSDDNSQEDDWNDVAVKPLRNAKPGWGTKKRRTESNQANQKGNSRDHGRGKRTQADFAEWIQKRRSEGREAPPWAPAQWQYEISSSKEKRSLDEGVGKVTSRSPLFSGKLNRPVRRRKMVTRFDSRLPRELGGRHEGSAATSRKPPIRKRKAGILTDDEFPEANGFDALSNRRPRSDDSERAALERIDAFLAGELAGQYSQWDDLDAMVNGQFLRPGTVVHGPQSHCYSGREKSPPLPSLDLEDLGAYIGSHSHSSPQVGGGGVQDRDVFGLASEPSTNDSLEITLSEARQSSDEDYQPSAGNSPYDYEIDNVGVPIPTSSYSYPSRSRRSLSYRNDGVPQRVVGSISTQLPDDGAPPAHPGNAAQPPISDMSAVFYANPIQDNEHASLGTSAVPSMNGAIMAAGLEGDEDYEPDDGNQLDEEEEEGFLDLNETPGLEKHLPRNSRARKKHRPKVFREGRPDGRRKPKNAEEGISKKKVSEGKKVVGNPRGRKKGATSGLKSAQGDTLGKQGDHFMPVAANCRPGTDGCAECQNSKGTSDAGRCMHSQGRRATETEDFSQSRGDSGFPKNEGPQTPRRQYILVNNSLVEVRVQPSSPNAHDCSALVTSASASPSPSRKRSGEDEGLVVVDSPQRRVRRELFKEARTPKRITAHSKDCSGWVRTGQESQKEAIAHPRVVSGAKTVGTRPRMRKDASHSQELVPLELMGTELCDPAAEVVGAVTSIKCNSSNSEEVVLHESSIIAIVLGKQNRSTTTPEENVLHANRGRPRAAGGVHARQPNDPNRVKRAYTRRTPKLTEVDLLVNRLAHMNLKECDSGLQLVPYANQNTAMVPFMPLRRKKPRARVMLDGEDKRVWRLLMTQGTSFEDASSEKETPRQWDEERTTMKARAEKFINRMHLVQGDRRFSVWKGSVVDSIVGAFLTQNVSDHLSSSAFMYLAARFPVARKKKAAAETSQEATVTEVQVEEADEISLKASRIGAEAGQECRMTAFHVEEAFDISEKSSGTGERSSICCNRQGHDTMSTKLTVINCERDGEPTTQILEKRVRNTIQEHIKWHYYAEERLTDTREQNSSCSSKTSQSLCNSSEHNATSHAGDSLEVRESEENKTCGVVEDDSEHNATSHAGDSLEVRDSKENKTCGVAEDDTFLHSGLGDVLLASSGHSQLNSIESPPLVEVRESEENKTCGVVEDDISLHSGLGDLLLGSSGHGQLNSIDIPAIADVGKREVTKMTMPSPNSWIQTDSEVSLIVDLSPTLDDLMTDVDSPLEAIRNGRYESANSLRTHEIGANSIPQKKNCCPALPGLDVTCAAAEEIAASSGSVVSSSASHDSNKLSQSFATLGSERNSVISEEIGAHRDGVIFPVDSFDTNKSSDQQLVISSPEPSEDLHEQLDVSPRLRILKSLMRKKVQTMRKAKTGPKSLTVRSNSELVNGAGDNQEEKVRGRNRRPVISLTGIARARLEQSNITSKVAFDWEAVRLKYTGPEMGENKQDSAHAGCKSFGSSDVENGVDWDAVRSAELEDIAEVIKERGMNNVLAGRIKAFLERVQKEHGSVDLEWLRTVSVEEAKSFLLSIRGLGLKSVECIRLLTLHHLAFPVDTNVGRICVRLGWVPLEPLPEELQLHLLEMYPVQETIQKYLWPRLCTLDQRTLYELHYQMITFGKVFCTKSRPNCNACPMRDDCQHFASALASSRLALPDAADEDARPKNSEPLALPAAAAEFMKNFNLALLPSEQDDVVTGEEGVVPATLSQTACEPLIEEPRTPEPEIGDIEDYETFGGASSQPSGSEKGSSSEIELVVPPTEVSIPDSASKALVVLPPDSASIPVPKLKNIGRLRTVHYVYELPDSHPLVQEMDPREDDDPCFYLLAIWSPGESPHAPPVLDDMYTNGTCDGFNSTEEETVKGTVLVPCRTAMRGIFPLNGTYFQVNEVFADHASSLEPIEVPRTLLWNLRRRFVYFGTSVTSIFKGLSTEEIQACFWRGYVCVRGFDSGSRCPRPLAARLHFPASKLIRKQKGGKNSPSNAED